MLILGIETSCDETSASIVKDGKTIISNIITSQDEIHAPFGGIVPELASREQLESIGWVVREALDKANIQLNKIDAIAVTYGPGLAGSLLIGVEFAKALSYALSIPLIGVNHIQAHLYANFLEDSKIKFPYIGLVISGGHTSLFYVKDFLTYSFLGQTRDDACGEAFDKGAQILKLGYPGGPVIDRISKKGNLSAIKFPRAKMKNPFDFSFSGLKTSLSRYVEKRGKITKKELPDIAASFQEAIADALVKKTILAAEYKKTNTIIVGGGVAANSRIRFKMQQEANKNNLKVYFPNQLKLCTDNAAMIAGLAYWMFKKGKTSSLTLDAKPNLSH
ncbi:MAG: tRNA (adenosine(37)-N6)-threonylcarbamoyltransferase complex transferase subunit TsaD [Candidatus Omnitrophica bacterium]|nr:tRNA (adenosine(37)-N6)-threonylcarbamoyltransferase complex transferase subunit TsaD [Candidatus Omnitrophota bacterium]MBU1048074.1 tRNA (adenosine(37)-N6)-threonylcarbamoyltransferase complex transferase subunit TsaD [Candidatus Omnitrophota bacterium]MBU1889444.1 tRNA (adenosine(37)-N6)-threonylcarbamoyltransferase complex transferase subunit TsaD [Candidatus Omnitrophota bacterium]